MVVELSYARSYPVDRETAFARVMPAALPQVFRRRYAALPPIRRVSDQEGEWGTVGQTRTIHLADGGTMRETLTAVEAPSRFGYDITDVTGPMSLLVEGLQGLWTFEPAGTGVRVTWSWRLRPRGLAGAAAMPAFTRMWRGYARQAMEEIEGLLTP